jgi:hypothetical protein
MQAMELQLRGVLLSRRVWTPRCQHANRALQAAWMQKRQASARSRLVCKAEQQLELEPPGEYCMPVSVRS